MKPLFYLPNLIGYLRIILLVVAYIAHKSSFTKFTIFYLCSFALDSIDGEVARMLKQVTWYGTILDQLIDRMGNLMLVCMCIRVSECLLLVVAGFWKPT